MAEGIITLLDKFNKYVPDAEERRLLEQGRISRLRADKDRRIVEVRCDFDEVFSKELLYRVEEKLATVYSLSLVRILPHYPSDLFSADYTADVLREAGRMGALTVGFFCDMKTRFDGETLNVEIPFSDGGLMLLDLADTARIAENIIKNEFGLDLHVEINKSADSEERERAYYLNQEKKLRDHGRQIAQEIRKREERIASEAAAENEKSDKPDLKKVASLFEVGDAEAVGDGLIKSGAVTFDVSSPVPVFGEPFTIENVTPISSIIGKSKEIVVLGEVFSVTSRETKRKDKIIVTVSLTDKRSSIFVRVSVEPDFLSEVTDAFRVGGCYAIRGDVRIDTYDGDPYITYRDVMSVCKVERTDTADEKRVELHLHTNMSMMDALPTAEQVVKLAHKWGHPAVAITDHGNLQSFPSAMITAEKIGDPDFKVIYGIEAYFVDDTQRAAIGGDDVSFGDEFVVFDLETTGLSPIACKIIEIGPANIFLRISRN